MAGVLKADKLEELLVANWTAFLDARELMAYVLCRVRDSVRGNFAVVAQQAPGGNGVQITLSRCRLAGDGLLLWVDFKVPQEYGVTVGTSEIHLSPAGTLEHVRTVGNIFGL
jgi:hypothetical protein